MSLWLQMTTQAFSSGDYRQVRQNLRTAPFRVPECMLRELEYAERCCLGSGKDGLFPIRYFWAWEANEYRLYGLPLGWRSPYHPEKLLQLWEKASTDSRFRAELEAKGFLFDRAGLAINLGGGWILIGQSFAQDFLTVEALLGIVLPLPGDSSDDLHPAFVDYRARKQQVGSHHHP